MIRAAVLLGLIAACGQDAPFVQPRLDAPPPGSDAFPFDGLDELRLSVARAGEDGALVERTMPFDDQVGLDGVPFGTDLVIHWSGRAGEVELAYGRTCGFDVLADGPSVAEPHIYVSRIVKWGLGPRPLVAERSGGFAYALPDGSAVFVGGGDTLVERFDPLESGDFAPLETPLIDRLDPIYAAFPDGRLLILGGAMNGNALPTVELLAASPEVPPNRQVETADGPRLRASAATALVDGRVLVTGGETQAVDGGVFIKTSEAWLFGFADGNVLAAPRRLAVSLESPRAHHSMTRLGDEVGADVLIVGGRDNLGNAIATAELYRPLREGFEPLPSALLNIPRWGHAAVRLPGGFILIAGGLTNPIGGGDPVGVSELELYDPVQGRFNFAGVLPIGAGNTAMTVTSLPDGRVLLAGGLSSAATPVATVLIARLDPINGQVDISVTNALDAPRAGHHAVSLCDGTVLVAGGADAPSERYNPPSANRR